MSLYDPCEHPEESTVRLSDTATEVHRYRCNDCGAVTGIKRKELTSA